MIIIQNLSSCDQKHGTRKTTTRTSFENVTCVAAMISRLFAVV